ncbi:GrpB family protein [Beijerinckia indica]|uniref:GrpB family protein n=1 Tax=Beijerinckia indica TaxID=533 RepID=UPI0013052232|nr:GrpB family protein [Beijerinckia indica]
MKNQELQRSECVVMLSPDMVGPVAEEAFQTLRQQLLAKLPKDVDIEHIGATSIPGCLTKGDLDIVIRVQHAQFAEVDRNLARLFIRNVGSVRTDSFSSFKDDARHPR